MHLRCRTCDWQHNPLQDFLRLADKSEVFSGSKEVLTLLLSCEVFDRGTRFNGSDDDSLKEMEVRSRGMSMARCSDARTDVSTPTHASHSKRSTKRRPRRHHRRLRTHRLPRRPRHRPRLRLRLHLRNIPSHSPALPVYGARSAAAAARKHARSGPGSASSPARRVQRAPRSTRRTCVSSCGARARANAAVRARARRAAASRSRARTHGTAGADAPARAAPPPASRRRDCSSWQAAVPLPDYVSVAALVRTGDGDPGRQSRTRSCAYG